MKIKKLSLIILLIFVLSSLCACAANDLHEQVTMQQIYDVNNNQSILERNNSFTVVFENEAENYKFFINPDMRYGYENGNHEVVNEDGHFLKTQNGIYTKVLYAGEELTPKDVDLIVSKEITLNEEIIESICDEETLYVKTRLKKEIYDIIKSDENSAYLEMEYTLNPDTFEIATTVETIYDEAGEIITQTHCIVKYNNVLPREASDIISHFKKVDQKDEEKRIIKLVLDPGTAAEKSYSTEIPKGDSVSIVRPEGYNAIFVNRELSQRFAGDNDLTKNLILYSAMGK